MTEMTESHPSTNFADEYPMPVNQLTYEMDMDAHFSQQYPESSALMSGALVNVQRAAGINIPQYRVHEDDRLDAEMSGMSDELGFLNAPFSPLGQESIVLQMPVEHTQEQIAAMTDAERLEASKTHDGVVVIGELPPATKRLLEDIYTLTGAKVVRDGHDAGERHGVIIREGEYHGTKVYFAEYYDDASPYYNGKSTLSVKMLGSEGAQELIHEPSAAERKEFIQTSGIDPFEARHFIAENNVTSDNYHQVADVLRQTRQIIEGEDVDEWGPVTTHTGTTTTQEAEQPINDEQVTSALGAASIAGVQSTGPKFDEPENWYRHEAVSSQRTRIHRPQPQDAKPARRKIFRRKK